MFSLQVLSNLLRLQTPELYAIFCLDIYNHGAAESNVHLMARFCLGGFCNEWSRPRDENDSISGSLYSTEYNCSGLSVFTPVPRLKCTYGIELWKSA